MAIHDNPTDNQIWSSPGTDGDECVDLLVGAHEERLYERRAAARSFSLTPFSFTRRIPTVF